MPYSVDGASLALGLMIAAYDHDEAAWKSLVRGVDGIVIADALRFMVDTYATRAGEDAKQRLLNEKTANPLRTAADAAVAVFSAEVDANGDDPRQVMQDAALRVAKQRRIDPI
jgi:hypothetical protein